MSLRINKQIGYALYPEQGLESAALYERIKSELDGGYDQFAPPLTQQYAEDYRQFRKDATGSSDSHNEPNYSEMRSDHAFLFHEFNDEDCAMSDIILFTPPRHLSEWHRWDNIVDYMEADEMSSSVVSLSQNIFPCTSSGAYDLHTYNALPLQEVRDFLRYADGENKEEEVSETLAQYYAGLLGYKDSQSALNSVQILPPSEIMFMAHLTGLFNNAEEVCLLQPTSYTYWV